MATASPSSANRLDALLADVDTVLAANTEVVAVADRALSGSAYMAVVRAERETVAQRAAERAAARAARDAGRGPSGARSVSRRQAF